MGDTGGGGGVARLAKIRPIPSVVDCAVGTGIRTFPMGSSFSSFLPPSFSSSLDDRLPTSTQSLL